MSEPDPAQAQADLDAYKPPPELDHLADPGSIAITDAYEYAAQNIVIIRACTNCGGRREDADAPCPTCGNTVRAETDDLGLANLVHRDPERAAWWFRVGRLRFEARVRKANKNAERLRKSF